MSSPEFADLAMLASLGRPGFEAFAAKEGLDPFDCAVMVCRALAGFPPEYSEEAMRLMREEIGLRRLRIDAENRAAIAALDARREREGWYGRCPCGRQGTRRWPLQPRTTGGVFMCFFCGTVAA